MLEDLIGYLQDLHTVWGNVPVYVGTSHDDAKAIKGLAVRADITKYNEETNTWDSSEVNDKPMARVFIFSTPPMEACESAMREKTGDTPKDNYEFTSFIGIGDEGEYELKFSPQH